MLTITSRFSKESLFQMLTVVTRVSQSPKTKSQSKSTMLKIKSFDQLRGLVEAIEASGKTRDLGEEEAQAMKYFDTFQNDLDYLRDLKKYFDERIYKCLYEHYYDAADDVQAIVSNTRSRHSRALVKNDDEDSGHYSQTETDDFKHHTDSQPKKSPRGHDAMIEKQTLSKAVRDLYDINRKWDGLLKETDLDLNDFDPDSHHELIQFVNYTAFEPILRLIPDVLVKCFKSVDISKTWWTQANKVYATLPLKKQNITNGEFARQVQTMKSQITDVSASIERDMKQVQICNHELKRLLVRDDRLNDVTNTYEEMDTLLHGAHAR